MPTDPERIFAERLRYYIRPEEDHRAFCREHGFNETRLSKQLKAERLNPRLRTVAHFAQALGCDPADLISEREVGNAAVAVTAPEYAAQAPSELVQVTTELRQLRLELRRIAKILEGNKP
jgi:hypothetical protein